MSVFNAHKRITILFVVLVLSVFSASLAFASTTEPARQGVSQATSLTVCVTDDTRVEQLNPDTNYGGDLRMEVDTIRGDGRQERIVSYVKFDLSSVPSGATLTGATLRLMVRTGGTEGTDYDVNVHSVPNSSWSEGTMTWNNQPGMGGILGVIPARMEPGDRVSAGLSTSFYSGPGFYSFGLAYPPDATHSDGIDFGTKEDPADNDFGCLDVTYTTGSGPAPQPPAPQPPAPQPPAPQPPVPQPPAPQPPTDETPTDQPTDEPEPTATPQPTPTLPPDVPVYSQADHRRAQAPLCMDLSGQTSPAVRASVPDDSVLGGSVYCRVLARDGIFPNPADPGRIGDPGLITYGVITAVDVFGVNDGGYADPTFAHGVTICLEGEGRFIYLSALNSPRTTYEPPSFMEEGYTCATIPAAGTVVLIPPQPLN